METQSLGRARPASTSATRSHIVFTDQKGRKIPYADRTTGGPLISSECKPMTHAVRNNETNYSRLQIGIYGWRKKCLFTLVMFLLLMLIVNLALTLWVLKVMDFNLGGMGELKIVPGGIHLLGHAIFLDSLFASSIKSRRGQSITIESSKNFTISARDHRGLVTNKLQLGHDRVECDASNFVIKDSKGLSLLTASKEHVNIGAENVAMTGNGGVSFDGAIQASVVRSAAGQALTLESPTRSLEMKASQKISLESRAGDITSTCLNNFLLQSIVGSIRLDASSVYLPKLKSALPLPGPSSHVRDPHHHDIYQLCVCANGKLFLAPPHGICAVRDESLICR